MTEPAPAAAPEPEAAPRPLRTVVLVGHTASGKSALSQALLGDGALTLWPAGPGLGAADAEHGDGECQPQRHPLRVEQSVGDE